MIGLALGLAALGAVLVVGWRKASAWRAEQHRSGRSPESAIPVRDYGEIDLTVAGQRCQCGGRFSVRGEGPRDYLRIVHLECSNCERERVVYFDLRTIRH